MTLILVITTTMMMIMRVKKASGVKKYRSVGWKENKVKNKITNGDVGGERKERGRIVSEKVNGRERKRRRLKQERKPEKEQ